jgi:hypothetical protein
MTSDQAWEGEFLERIAPPDDGKSLKLKYIRPELPYFGDVKLVMGDRLTYPKKSSDTCQLVSCN